jgi:hypothetical protein
MQFNIVIDGLRPEQCEATHLIETGRVAPGRRRFGVGVAHDPRGEMDDGFVDEVVLEE